MCVVSVTNNITSLRIYFIIVPAHFNSRSGMAMITNPIVVMIRCGEDLEAISFTSATIVQIMCPLFNGTDTTTTAFRDGMELNSPVLTGTTVQFGPVPPPDDTIFGTYTFIARNNCSEDIEITNIRRQGQYSHVQYVRTLNFVLSTI